MRPMTPRRWKLVALGLLIGVASWIAVLVETQWWVLQ